jgi:hypothetical protein
VCERQQETFSLYPTAISPTPRPGVEPAVDHAQLRGARRGLEEAEGGAERGEAAVSHDVAHYQTARPAITTAKMTKASARTLSHRALYLAQNGHRRVLLRLGNLAKALGVKVGRWSEYVG